ncbi:Pentatricopeptide repeat-containing protein [Platanthera zijinensis]|uniref:Pentatricopeptide repeat-containing protein n=1 Tax=Platanthera zijinensis TaxID=2320716 RepID=A0AAP0GEC1_9ASPA
MCSDVCYSLELSSSAAAIADDVGRSSNPHPPGPTPTLRRCIALLQTRSSLPQLRQIHGRAVRTGIPLSHPLFAKHLIFSLLSVAAPPLPYAELIFSLLPTPNIFTVNTMIRGYAESPHPLPALLLHRRLHSSSLPPDSHTYPFLLKACARLIDLRHGEAVHSLSLKNAHASSVFVQNSLLHFYAACGLFESAHRLFDGMLVRNLVTWNSVINAYAMNGRPNEALTLCQQMLNDDGGVKPDGFTMVSLLSACAELGSLALGRRVHVYLFKSGLYDNSHAGNALIDLYAKCGGAAEARRVFDEMPVRTVVSWTSVIVGLAVNGFSKEALRLFNAMEMEKLKPTEITLVGVLYACSHCGLIDQGFRYFNKMKEEYGIAPKIEHYGCMVDLLGRAGFVDRAHDYILKMPLTPNAIVWRTLLGACAMHKRVAVGEVAWSRLVELDPGHSGDYVLLSNLYAGGGRWADVQRLRKSMIKGGVKKTPGHSLLELGNRVHDFMMGDKSHPETEAIYEKIEEIAKRLRKEGYIARTVNVLADIEEEEKETALGYHSERLAIAFGLMKSAPGAAIRIVKNLRVCEDCHLVIKLISRVYEREIVVRDRSRFHHFRDASCSCKDYW